MKNKLVKGLVTLSLAGALALSGVTAVGTGLNAVEAAKIVDYTTLSAVTGIGYNAEDNTIYWNKVPNATCYYVTITTPSGYTTTKRYVSGLSYSMEDYAAGTYTVTVEAVDRDSAYVVAQDVPGYNPPAGWDSSYYYGFRESKEAGGNVYYSYYSYPRSTGTAQITIPDTSKKMVTNAITAAPEIVIKEVQENSIVVKPSSFVNLNSGERLYIEYSNNAQFKNDSTKDLFAETNSIWYYAEEQDVNIYFSDFLPDETIYVRARVYNSNYGAKYDEYGWWENSTPDEQRYSAYSNTLTYVVTKAKISYVTATTTTNSVTLNVSTSNGAVTGYQFAKKVGSKWVTLDTQTDPCYVDSALVKNTKYQYRVRAYTYNKAANKTIWTDWYTVNTTTWGSNLNVKAAAKSATSVKLTWKPVSGAEGYEIYRCDTDSSELTKEKGVWIDSASKEYLVKTIKKAKTKTYTEKKLSKNASYTYVVRAYRTIGKQKVYLEDSAYITLRPGSLSIDEYTKANGQVVATWSKQTGLKGYYVEKYDETTGEYQTIKTLKATATSYTFPKVAAGSERVYYRIRPFDKTTVYDGATVEVYGTLATPTSVKATRTATGVQITWKAVEGADYYHVYRTKDGEYTYDKTTKKYTYQGYRELVYEAAVNTANCHPEYGDKGYSEFGTYATTEIRGTSVEDKTVVYQGLSKDDNGELIKVGQTTDGKTIYQTEEKIYYVEEEDHYCEGPEAGTTYYYYVVAYAKAPNGYNGEDAHSSDSKAAKITYTNAIAKKVSKITSVKSSKKGQATISYKKVKGVDGYAVYRSTKKNGTYTLVGTSTKTKFTDASATSGKTYYYKVASYVKGEQKANIYSAKTAAKKVKIK